MPFGTIGPLVLSGGAFVCSLLTLLAVLSRRGGDGHDVLRRMEELRRDILDDLRDSRQESLSGAQGSIKALGGLLAQGQEAAAAAQDKRLAELSAQTASGQRTLQSAVLEMMRRTDARLDADAAQTAEKLEGIRAAVEGRLAAIQAENSGKLEQMRATVDEKLEKTLQERIGQSFQMVGERLEQVYKGLGEMQSLAAGVGDLKKVLSGVKTRGVLGEVQLGAILEEILAPEQYATNVATKRGSSGVVEYAVRLPGSGDGTVWLPIDAKFPLDAYEQLANAYEAGDAAAAGEAGTALDRRIRSFAKEIRDKYIDPPATTDFAVLFLPFEGLYAEVARRGLIEPLQREYRITVAGPTTMAAFLNSLQMGFRTLAIQKRSGEVWRILGEVKTEFEKFSGALDAAQQRIAQAGTELDKLVGVRTRQIQRRLASVAVLPEDLLESETPQPPEMPQPGAPHGEE